MEELVKKLEQIMHESRVSLILQDNIYQQDIEDEKKLEKRFEALNLEPAERMLIDDYIACIRTAGDRFAELSYVAGVQGTARISSVFQKVETDRILKNS